MTIDPLKIYRSLGPEFQHGDVDWVKHMPRRTTFTPFEIHLDILVAFLQSASLPVFHGWFDENAYVLQRQEFPFE